MYSPNGWAEIKEFYEWDPEKYLSAEGVVKPEWREHSMVFVPLPEPCSLSWEPSVSVTRVVLHRKAASVFREFYERVSRSGLWHVVRVLGGTYEFRRIGGSEKLSLHSLGAADDRDPLSNARGVHPAETKIGGTEDGLRVVEIAESLGLTWGGRFSRPDAMHFQLGRGY